MIIQIDRKKNIGAATPTEVFTVLSNPDELVRLIPNLHRVDVVDRTQDSAQLTLCLSIGQMFGVICFQGSLSWVEPREIVFRVHNPIPVEVRWTLTPSVTGTDVRVDVSMDLAFLLGPLARFVPQATVQSVIGKDFEQVLQGVSARFESRPNPQFCPIPLPLPLQKLQPLAA